MSSVTESPQQAKDREDKFYHQVLLVAFITLGIFVGVITVVMLIYCCCCRKKRKERKARDPNPQLDNDCHNNNTNKGVNNFDGYPNAGSPNLGGGGGDQVNNFSSTDGGSAV